MKGKASKNIYYKLVNKFAISKEKRHKARQALSNEYRNKGINNKLIFIKGNKEYVLDEYNFCESDLSNVRITITGNNNTIKIHLPNSLKYVDINCSASNVNIEIGKECIIRKSKFTIWGGDKKSSIKIGNSCTFWNNFQLFVNGCASFEMGDDCMCSYDIQIWCGDGHRVINKTNGDVVNLQKRPLSIGRHCWISNNVLMTKNAVIPNNTIVGMGAVVSGKFEQEYTCIAGNPAKVVKHNVDWDRKNI